MSAVPEVLPSGGFQEAPNHDEPAVRAGGGLPRAARIYLLVLGILTIASAAKFYVGATRVHHGWVTFVILAAAATLAHTFPVKSPRNSQYHTSVLFLVAAALLLPPELIVLIPLVQTIPEWLKERTPWQIQGFNISNYTLDTLAAWGTAHLLIHHTSFISNVNARFAFAGLAASVAFVAVNHLLVAIILKLGRGHSFRETGLFGLEQVSVDVVLTILGVSLAAFWNWNPWLIFAALAPLVVVHRSLSVPQLQAEARVDPKTGLYNARYFATTLAAELARAARFERPMSLIMADLDLLRDINNSYGHLAGDAVLKGIAEIFHRELRHYDVPARFGGEEFSILLPETPPEQAMEIAERIRRAVAEREFEVETAAEPIRATVSLGVAGFPKDGMDANELIHQADLAVYRGKLQGRNRVVGASTEPLLMAAERSAKLRAVVEDGEHIATLPAAEPIELAEERRSTPKPRTLHGPTFFQLSTRLALVVASVSVIGIGAGAAGLIWGSSHDYVGLLAVLALVGAGQALSFELAEVEGSLSVSVVGSLAGAALFDYRAALPLAVTIAVVDWSARRNSLHTVIYNIGTMALSSLAAASVFTIWTGSGDVGRLIVAAIGLLGGSVYFLVNMGLLSFASGVEGHESPWAVFHERFAWLLPHYVVYGFIGAVMGIGYEAVGLYGLAVFAVPLLLMRKTQEAYLKHTQKSAAKLREAADTIQSQNVSLEQANKLLRERSTAAMESLSATVDARDSYTAGHSRRVQQLSLAIGRELGLSQAELDLLGHAALFHDIGKLAIPDAILLKPASLTGEEWALMQRHAEEGARIIDRLGFLQDAVPSIRHHHERFDGTGYPDRIAGEEIPLGARIIHVADALDSMLTTRIYRAARPVNEALSEVKDKAGTQFCPRCVGALERILPLESVVGDLPSVAPQVQPELVRAS